MEELRLRANGLEFGALAHGQGDVTALLLHGFPDDPHSWEPLMRRMAEAGYRVVAPWMRGYGPTDVPVDGDYQVAALASDAVGLLDALGWDHAMLVGHDWGALAAYAAGNLAPHRWERIVGVSVPPARLLLRNALRHPEQFVRSWYVFLFQVPLLPEWWLSHDDFELLERIWRAVSRAASADGDWELEWVKETFRRPGTLHAALGYYRALFPGRGGPPDGYRESWRLSLERLTRPTLLVAGDHDPAIAVETFENPGTAIDADWVFERFDGAGHFVQLERPDELARSILSFAPVAEAA